MIWRDVTVLVVVSAGRVVTAVEVNGGKRVVTITDVLGLLVNVRVVIDCEHQSAQVHQSQVCLQESELPSRSKSWSQWSQSLPNQ